jgi:hypothetical protein
VKPDGVTELIGVLSRADFVPTQRSIPAWISGVDDRRGIRSGWFYRHSEYASFVIVTFFYSGVFSVWQQLQRGQGSSLHPAFFASFFASSIDDPAGPIDLHLWQRM